MKTLMLLISLLAIVSQAKAQHSGHSMPHEMQHGFVLAADDKFASHLVATGHHSRQVEIIGQLVIDDQSELAFYQERKIKNTGNSYFIFQAQSLDLPTLSDGQVLVGHIVESKLGDYEPKNKIVKSAAFKVERVLLNIPNPFFTEEPLSIVQNQSLQSRKRENYANDLLNSGKPEKKHCCDTGAKPCNWKC